jgi:hypothetical protein
MTLIAIVKAKFSPKLSQKVAVCPPQKGGPNPVPQSYAYALMAFDNVIYINGESYPGPVNSRVTLELELGKLASLAAATHVSLIHLIQHSAVAT